MVKIFTSELLWWTNYVEFSSRKRLSGRQWAFITFFFVFAQICTELSWKCFMRASGNLPEQKPPVWVLIFYKLHYVYSLFVNLFFVLQTAFAKFVKTCNNALQNNSKFACIACALHCLHVDSAFHPQTEKLEPPWTPEQKTAQKKNLKKLNWNTTVRQEFIHILKT